MSDLKEKAKTVRFTGLDRLSRTRDTTQAEMLRDIDGAARDGQKIQKVAGGRAPTERFIDGEWVVTTLGERFA